MTAREKSQQEKSAPKAKDILLTVVLGCFAIALLVGIRAPDSTPLTPAKPPAQRKPMPDFTMPTLNGQQWILSQHRGHVVLLNFWATWCPPCQAETPSLVKIAGDYQAKGLDLAGVSMDTSGLGNVQAFVSSYHVPYPILLPRPFSPLTNTVQAFPTTILIDRQGRVANAFEGALDEATLRLQLERLLGEPAEK
jgi:peroxiredoxin